MDVSPLFSLPNEILFEVAKHLPRQSVMALEQTCRSLHLPLRALLIFQHKNTILIYAAHKNNINLLTIALTGGADITYRGTLLNEYGRHFRDSALHRAAAGGYTAIITELLRYNPPLEARCCNDDTPLFCAAWGGHQAAVDLLLSAGADSTALGHGKSTLLLAAISMNLERTATAYIGQMDQRALREAIKLKRLSITQLMFSLGIADTVSPPLYVAAAAGLPYVKLCLAHGARINDVSPDTKCTALSTAVATGNTNIAEYLLDEGADPNQGPKKYRSIMTAVNRGNTDMVRRLLHHGVDLTGLKNPHADVLVCACVCSPPELVALLLDAGQGLEPDGSGTDVRKAGPLHVAAEHGNTGVVKLLLSRGANMNARRGPKGETPLHWAARAAKKSAVEALLEAGADPQLMCNGATPLLMANRSWTEAATRAATMAALVRGGADINELGVKSRTVVSKVLALITPSVQSKGRKARM